MSSTGSKDEACKNSKKDLDVFASHSHVILDPFVPRSVPSYSYKMPTSSPSDVSDDDSLELSQTESPKTSTKEFDPIGNKRDQNGEQSFDYKQEPGATSDLKRSSTIVTEEQDAKYESKRPKVETEIASSSKYESMQVGSQYEPMQVGSQYEPMQVGSQYEPMQVGSQYESMHVGSQYESMQVGSQYESMHVGSQYKSIQESKYESKQESRYASKFEKKRATSKSYPPKLPIPIEVIKDTKKCINGLEKSIRQDIRYPRQNSNLDWNTKVLKFLEENLEAAKITNNELARRKK